MRVVVWGALPVPVVGAGVRGLTAMPVAVPAGLVHPALHYGASGFGISSGARGCVMSWGGAGGALPVVVCCVSCFVHVSCYLQCACSVVSTCATASFVLPLVSIVWLIDCLSQFTGLSPCAKGRIPIYHG